MTAVPLPRLFADMTRLPVTPDAAVAGQGVPDTDVAAVGCGTGPGPPDRSEAGRSSCAAAS